MIKHKVQIYLDTLEKIVKEATKEELLLVIAGAQRAKYYAFLEKLILLSTQKKNTVTVTLQDGKTMQVKQPEEYIWLKKEKE